MSMRHKIKFYKMTNLSKMEKLNAQIQKLRNEIRREKNSIPRIYNFKYLELEALIDKRDQLFFFLENK